MRRKLINETWLRKNHRFLGRVTIGRGWYSAIVLLQPDLKLRIFLPFDLIDKEVPDLIEGLIEQWNIKISDGAISISYRYYDFDSLNKEIQINEEEKRIFQNYHKKTWTEIIVLPKTCTFMRMAARTDIPDEWGITFYPGRNNTILFHFFSHDRNPRALPNTFSFIDESLYFINDIRWALDDLRKRIKLLTSCSSFFTGSPISYELLVGRHEKEVLVIHIKNEANPSAFICPSQENARIELKEKSLSAFSSDLIKKVEELYSNPERDKILILLTYFKLLYMAPYDEAKIAFSFQLMESLANYKKIKFKTSAKFDEYIGKALNAIKLEESFEANPASIKQIARKYRNEVFHGNFFETMTEIDHLIDTLPPGYKRDLPVLFQAIATMIGVNFILGIDFNQMVAIKRKMR